MVDCCRVGASGVVGVVSSGGTESVVRDRIVSSSTPPSSQRPCVSVSTSTVSASSSSPSTTSRGKGGEMDPFRLEESSSSSNIDDNIALPDIRHGHHDERVAETSSNQGQNNDQRDVDDAKHAEINDRHRDVPTKTRIERELEQLSEEERQTIVRDVQGVVPSNSNNSHISLSPSLLLPNDNLLPSFQHTLQHEIQNLQMQPGNEDLVSVLSSSGLANDTDLQKKMLLAECNDVPGAVNRLIGYFRLLQDMLGPKTCLAVSLSDMSEQDRQLQRKGTIQLFKFRDAHGRRVVGCFESGSGSCTSSLSQLKVMTYVLKSAAEDEPSQEKGVVVIYMMSRLHTATAMPDSSKRRFDSLLRVLHSSPIRIGAFHVCSPDLPEFHTAKTELVNSLERNIRLRTRLHHGTTMECSSAISHFGVPTDRLPLKYDGSVKLEDHHQWIAVREAKEDAQRQGKPFHVIECPLNMDILAGRGQLIRSHPGNVSFRQDFIHVRMLDYNKAFNREAKNDVANSVLEEIASLKRRFLKQHPTAAYWTELDYKTAKEKVMMAFREYRKVQKSNVAAATVAASTSTGAPTEQTHPLQARRTAPPMVAEGYRRPLHSPISTSRSNRDMAQPMEPVERQRHSPPEYHSQAYYRAYPDQNVHSHSGPDGSPIYPGIFSYPMHMMQDPRIGGPPHPPPYAAPGSLSPQRVFSEYDIQNQASGSQHGAYAPAQGSDHSQQQDDTNGAHRGPQRRGYDDHSRNPFDDYYHQP